MPGQDEGRKKKRTARNEKGKGKGKGGERIKARNGKGKDRRGERPTRSELMASECGAGFDQLINDVLLFA